MADVFISYHRSPGASALVRRIAGELENRNVSCWYDTQNAAPVDFVERIVTEIESCKAFVFLWDEQANEDSKKRNSYVRSEIQCAYGEKHIALFPFQVGDFEKNKTLKFYFGHINIPYGGDTPEIAHTTELVNAIADVLEKNQLTPEVTPQPQTLPPVVERRQSISKSPKKQVKPQSRHAKIIKTGKYGKGFDKVMYTLDENGVLIISGSGAMWESAWYSHIHPATSLYTISKITSWVDKREMISHVEIQNGITSIGSYAFYGCENLKSVSISDSVTSIGNFAFYNCEKLKRVSIPMNAKIEKDSFSTTTRVTRRKRKRNQ